MAGDLVRLLIGVVAAAIGGELFVRGSVGLAARARVPARLVGVTIAAFATSAPELSVGIQAAMAGRPELAVGDALGSNVMNIAFVLGLALLFGAVHERRDRLRRELSVAAAAPVLTLLALVDGRLTRSEGVVFLGVFVVWLVLVARQASRERTDPLPVGDRHGTWGLLPVFVGGLLLLVVAGRLIVLAAKGIGTAAGLDPFVVGATLVALGTSTPELATTLISRWRGHHDVALGSVLGSNVFNNLWIVGVVAVLHPVTTSAMEVLVAVVAGVASLLLLVPTRDGVVPKLRAPALLTVGAIYVGVTTALGP